MTDKSIDSAKWQSQEISKLASVCVDALIAGKEFKDDNERKRVSEIEYLYAIDCVKAILRDHCIVKKSEVKEVYEDACKEREYNPENPYWEGCIDSIATVFSQQNYLKE